MEFLKEEKHFNVLKNLEFIKINTKLEKRIDLCQIEKKCDRYKNFAEFRADINWFVHNCNVVHQGNDEITNASKELVKYIDDEIFSIKQCGQCYENEYKHPNESFVMLCDNPTHEIIWAKSDGFNFWPAKVMSVNNENNKVHVRYFGEYTVDDVDINDCYNYSKSPPDKSKCRLKGYLEALQVTNTDSI